MNRAHVSRLVVLLRVSALALVSAASLPGFSQTSASFVSHTFTSSGVAFPPGNTVWGDFNNDGFLDMLLLGSPVRLYRNEGAGAFTEVAAGLPPDFSGDAAWGDYDRDGYLDL